MGRFTGSPLSKEGVRDRNEEPALQWRHSFPIALITMHAAFDPLSALVDSVLSRYDHSERPKREGEARALEQQSGPRESYNEFKGGET
jgi:hypothetical protein